MCEVFEEYIKNNDLVKKEIKNGRKYTTHSIGGNHFVSIFKNKKKITACLSDQEMLNDLNTMTVNIARTQVLSGNHLF